MLNHINLMGRLTRAPELRKTANGASVTSFTLAVERDYGAKVTDFIDCVAWRQTAEFIGSYFTRGQMMIVGGRLESRKYQDRDGNPHTVWEVVVDNVYFGESKRVETGRPDPSYAPPYVSEEDEEELPF